MTKKKNKTILALCAFMCLFIFASCQEADTVAPFKAQSQFQSGVNEISLDDLLNGSIVSIEYVDNYDPLNPHRVRYTLNEKESRDGKTVYDVGSGIFADGVAGFSKREVFEKTSDGITRTIFNASTPHGIPPNESTEYNKWRINLLLVKDGRIYEYLVIDEKDVTSPIAMIYTKISDNTIRVSMHDYGFDIGEVERGTYSNIKVTRR